MKPLSNSFIFTVMNMQAMAVIFVAFGVCYLARATNIHNDRIVALEQIANELPLRDEVILSAGEHAKEMQNRIETLEHQVRVLAAIQKIDAAAGKDR